MREPIWNAYLTVQTAMAYGTDAWTGYCDASLALAATILPTLGPCGPTLVIGGGHPRELQLLRRPAFEPLHLLTAHAPEAQTARSQGIDAVCGDIHDMPYPTASMGLVFQSNVMEHVFAPYIALMECRRVSKEGGVGYFAIPEFEGPEHGVGEFHLHCLTGPVWQTLLTKTGWLVERMERALKADGHAYAHFICRAVPVPFPHAAALERIAEARARLADA